MSDVPVVRGDSIQWTVTFYTDTAATVPWDDVEDWTPVCQIRRDADAKAIAAVPALTVVDNVATFALTDEQTAALSVRQYLWDVQLTDPAADAGFGVTTWPGAGEQRNTLTVTADVTRVED